MATDRRVSNARNRAQGAEFERLIDAGCDFYRLSGAADIQKTPEPTKIIRNLGGGHFEAVFTKKAQPDYKGTLKGGKSVVFEAKFTSTGRLEQNRVTESQTKELELQWKLGAEVFILADFSHSVFARIPWILWRDMQRRFGRKYVTLHDCSGLVVPLKGALHFLDT